MLLKEMVDRDREREQAANTRAGVIAATICNVNRRKGQRMRRHTDFFRSHAPGSNAPTPEEIKRLEHRMAPSRSIRA